MYYVVKLRGSYRCDVPEYDVPQWWERQKATKYPTIESARIALDEMRQPWMRQKRAHNGQCGCDECYVPRVVRVRTSEDLKSERVAAMAVVAMAGKLAFAVRGLFKLTSEQDGEEFARIDDALSDYDRSVKALEAARAGRVP